MTFKEIHIKGVRANELVAQLIYNEIRDLLDCDDPETIADIEVYKHEFPAIFSEVVEAFHMERLGA